MLHDQILGFVVDMEMLNLHEKNSSELTWVLGIEDDKTISIWEHDDEDEVVKTTLQMMETLLIKKLVLLIDHVCEKDMNILTMLLSMSIFIQIDHQHDKVVKTYV